MFAVIFEVRPRPDRFEAYLALARTLKPALEAIDGFIANERFASRRSEGRILSLSTWRDERSLIRWRTLGLHHEAQEKGREAIFADYHLRVGEVAADTDFSETRNPPDRLRDEAGAAKSVTITEWSSPAAAPELSLDAAPGLLDHELFEGLSDPARRLLLASWQDEAAARAWTPRPSTTAVAPRHRRVRIIRDYGMFDRGEAPQYYPPVSPPGAS